MENVFEDLTPDFGFYDIEKDMWGPFVWAAGEFCIRKPEKGKFYSARMCYYGEEGKILVGGNGKWKKELKLRKGWNIYPLDFSDFKSGDIRFKVSPVIPVPGENRELGVMIRSFRQLESHKTIAFIEKALVNKKINHLEFTRGRLELESRPWIIRFSMESRCNIKPRCIYCDWERARSDEGDSGFRFTMETLNEAGDFYVCAEEIGELGHGEPMLHPDFMIIIEEFERAGKRFSLASNGQLLGKIDMDRLLGKDLDMYISIDSSNAEGYARYRNDQFERLIRNLRSLCRNKRKHAGLPVVIPSFIVMRSNKNEFEDYIDLMKDVGVDGVRVMSLDCYPGLRQRVETRNGFRFSYEHEALSFSQLNEFVDRARSLAAEKSLPFFSVVDFGKDDEGQGTPLCSEPWKSINVLNRGLIMCCNNKIDAVAKWPERRGRTVEQFLLDTWNGEKYQEIRRELADGRFPDFCLRAGECPIVKKKIESEHS